jgi:hypothetical protein
LTVATAGNAGAQHERETRISDLPSGPRLACLLFDIDIEIDIAILTSRES